MKTESLDIPCHVNLLRAQHYKLPRVEACFLDWLLLKHRSFNYQEFNYSYGQIESEFGIKRTQLDKIIAKFSKMGFLRVEAKGVAVLKTKKTHFDIDYTALLKTLPELIDKADEDYYKSWVAFCKTGKRGDRKNSDALAKDWKKQMRILHSELVDIWNQRIDLYNKERKDGRQNDHTTLPMSDKILTGLAKVNNQYGAENIKHSFLAFADAVIKDAYNTKRPLNNFLSNTDGEYKVIDCHLDKFNVDYSRG